MKAGLVETGSAQQLDSGCTLQVAPAGFVDGFDRVQIDDYIDDLRNWKTRAAFTEVVRTPSRVGSIGNQEFGLGEARSDRPQHRSDEGS